MKPTNTTKPLELAPGIVAHVGMAQSIGEINAAAYVEGVWWKEGPEWQRAVRLLVALPLVVIRRLSGLPPGLEWPPLPWDLDADCEALNVRFATLGTLSAEHDIPLRVVVELASRIKEEAAITEEEEGKSGSSSVGDSTCEQTPLLSGPPPGA